ncbi:MAG: hypothetical protein D8M58_00930 [Calditrichaeota bacterium]|nr:MAG: hypothetical protein DWQ03_06150 [Calditrichota bacterium]MBL1203931.1 hypothetical protein [Calditrichota bacterium]NOG43764.1 hypothetical protein [Calditrichota bacterium]
MSKIVKSLVFIVLLFFIGCSNMVKPEREIDVVESKIAKQTSSQINNTTDLERWNWNAGKDLDFWITSAAQANIDVSGLLHSSNGTINTTYSSSSYGIHHIVDVPPNFTPQNYNIVIIDNIVLEIEGTCNEYDTYLYDDFNEYKSHINAVTPDQTIEISPSGSPASLNIFCNVLQPDEFWLKIYIEKSSEPAILIHNQLYQFPFNEWSRIKKIELPYFFDQTGAYTIRYELRSTYAEISETGPINPGPDFIETEYSTVLVKQSYGNGDW